MVQYPVNMTDAFQIKFPRVITTLCGLTLSYWWDCKGIVYFELFKTGKTIKTDKYCDKLDK